MYVGAQPSAVLDVRLLPWRPRLRVMPADTLRDGSDPFFALEGEDPVGLLMSLVLSVVLLAAIWVLAPVLVVVRWSVLVLDPSTGEEHVERFRLLWRATRRVREINGDRRVRVRWGWA